MSDDADLDALDALAKYGMDATWRGLRAEASLAHDPGSRNDLNAYSRTAKQGADAIAALVAELRAARAAIGTLTAERDSAQEHLAYHLADFRPGAEAKATGDLAVDMAAYARRLKTDLDVARAALRAMEGLHKPRVIECIDDPACIAEECDHEDQCPANGRITVCGGCYDLCEEASPYFMEDHVSAALWPCPTVAAVKVWSDCERSE